MVLWNNLPSGFRTVARLLNQTGRAQFRRAQYAAAHFNRRSPEDIGSSAWRHPDIMEALNERSFALIPSAIPERTLDALRQEMDAALAARMVFPVTRIRRTEGAPPYLTAEELTKDEAYIAAQANIAYVRDPLINCPTTRQIVFDDLVMDIATDFYGVCPAITGCNLLKSFVNELPEAGYNMFHSDVQSTRFIKFFVYLDDVDEGSGPFCIVQGSHQRKPAGWRMNNNRTLDNIEFVYGPESVRLVAARAGDLIVADTTAFHRAQKPSACPRRALMINTGIHQIRRAIGDAPTMFDNHYRALSPKQQSFADFIRLLPSKGHDSAA